ncbi:peptidoglycan/LPS O-acetylase OafA/YrhL [Aeromicrobium panaciterrae]|uniref:Peptidoglycan/LPS O-acetylase OafA/YrhL n=1 Tax=Aeromicrobium panaciterrae TaxID=363861 RepID=A0ABU1UPL6_9ACTN|nr:acyltransferase [Aeromicrobium panaciterrae]MDR7087088.1 peptidoglycan/LPS O-acetylase OafA/YrhL [Aeromicrobium panaciterrae]
MSSPASDGAPFTTDHEVFPGLDSLRALASLAVVGTHVAFWAGIYPDGLLGAMSSRLDIGVAFFFVLSGFLLGHPFLLAMAGGRRRPSTGRYFWKRALRIVPLALIVTIAALALLDQNKQADLGTWVGNLTLTELYVTGALPAGLTHMWSLATEVAFYVVLPGLMALIARLVCRRGWNPRGILTSLGVLVVLNVVWLVAIAPQRVGAGQWLPAYLSWFSVGIALAVIAIDRRRPGRDNTWSFWSTLAGQPGICWVMALALFAVAATPVGGPSLLIAPTHTEAVSKNLLYAVIAGLIVLPSVLGPASGTPYSNFLGQRILRHLGHISYGIFCIHLLVIHAVASWRDIPVFQGNGWELFALTVVITLVLAEIAYRVVERPAMRLKNAQISRSKSTPPAAASAATTHH